MITNSDAYQNFLKLTTVGNKEGGESTDKFGGWYLEMDAGNGEKVLSNPSVFDGIVNFVTYTPKTDTLSCSPVPGINRLYAMSITDGSGQLDRKRSEELKNTGIISGGTYLHLDPDEIPVIDSSNSTGLPDEGVEPDFPDCPRITIAIHGTEVVLLDCNNSQRKTYWYDQRVVEAPAK